jgi:hypothetical protein
MGRRPTLEGVSNSGIGSRPRISVRTEPPSAKSPSATAFKKRAVILRGLRRDTPGDDGFADDSGHAMAEAVAAASMIRDLARCGASRGCPPIDRVG